MLALWRVLGEEFEECLGWTLRVRLTLVLAHSAGELGDGGGDFESVEEQSLLSLEQNVLWPSEEPSHISLWLDIVPDSEVLWGGFEEWVPLTVLLGRGFCCSFLYLFLEGCPTIEYFCKYL